MRLHCKYLKSHDYCLNQISNACRPIDSFQIPHCQEVPHGHPSCRCACSCTVYPLAGRRYCCGRSTAWIKTLWGRAGRSGAVIGGSKQPTRGTTARWLETAQGDSRPYVCSRCTVDTSAIIPDPRAATDSCGETRSTKQSRTSRRAVWSDLLRSEEV